MKEQQIIQLIVRAHNKLAMKSPKTHLYAALFEAETGTGVGVFNSRTYAGIYCDTGCFGVESPFDDETFWAIFREATSQRLPFKLSDVEVSQTTIDQNQDRTWISKEKYPAEELLRLMEIAKEEYDCYLFDDEDSPAEAFAITNESGDLVLILNPFINGDHIEECGDIWMDTNDIEKLLDRSLIDRSDLTEANRKAKKRFLRNVGKVFDMIAGTDDEADWWETKEFKTVVKIAN